MAASAAQSAANAVQAGTKELTSKVMWILFVRLIVPEFCAGCSFRLYCVWSELMVCLGCLLNLF